MGKNKRTSEEQAPGTPGWIVSFTDMITLLLAFFVMLQALAKEQNPELFYQGQGAFKRAIAGLGLPEWFFGKDRKLDAKPDQRRYPTEKSENKLQRARVLDAEDERIREMFKTLRRQMETSTSNELPRASNIVITPIRFLPGEASLSSDARVYLTGLAVDLRQNVRQGVARQLYVVGSAGDVPPGREQWMLATARATAVADMLKEALTGAGDWRVHAWGDAGAAQDNTGTRTNGLEFVRIAILGAD